MLIYLSLFHIFMEVIQVIECCAFNSLKGVKSGGNG